MRLLVAGLVLVLLGVAVTEYSRRHPDAAEPKRSAPSTKAGPRAPQPPPAGDSLLETGKVEAPASELPEAFQAMVTGFAPTAPGTGPLKLLLSGSFSVRDVKAGEGFAVVVVEKLGQRALVRVAPQEAPRVLAVRKAQVTALAIDGARVLWAEDGALLSIDAAGTVTPLVKFTRAAVAGLAVRGDVVLAALGPRDADPFAADPNGSVVKVSSDGKVTLVASEQIRPHDLLTDGREAFWVAGYPSGLVRAALDGAFSARIVDRADGPLSFDADGLVFRLPHTSGSELRRTAKAGGQSRTITTADTDAATASQDLVRYTTSGIGARLYEVKDAGEPRELMQFRGTVKGLSSAGATLVFSFLDDEGKSNVLAQ